MSGPPQDSMLASISTLLNDKATSDFTIICRGRHFYVHKLILGCRSEYFKRLFSKETYVENQTNELQLTPTGTPMSAYDTTAIFRSYDDDDCYLVYGLLKAVYCDDYPLYEHCSAEVDGHQAELEYDPHYHKRLSELADRYAMKCVDAIIARKVFVHGFNIHNVRYRAGIRPGNTENFVKHSTAFREAMCTVFKNAKRSGCQTACDLVANFAVDWLYVLGPGSEAKLMETPGLSEAILEELVNGKARMQCPKCHAVVRLDATQTLNLQHKTLCFSDREKARLTAFRHESQPCTNCGKSWPSLLGLRNWRMMGLDIGEYDLPDDDDRWFCSLT